MRKFTAVLLSFIICSALLSAISVFAAEYTYADDIKIYVKDATAKTFIENALEDGVGTVIVATA
jgi:Fe2+ transport system protein B